MPKVGNKTYPYNTKGMQAAKKAAKKKGKMGQRARLAKTLRGFKK